MKAALAFLLPESAAKVALVLGQFSCALVWVLWLALSLTTSTAWAKDEAGTPQILDSMRFQRLLAGEEESHKGRIGVVFSIVQDEAGFLWFGGDSGLARYDAHSFKFYEADPKNPRGRRGPD